MDNRPRGREQHVTGQGKPIYKRGDGLGGGPVGNGGGYSGRGGNGGGPKRSGGGSKLLYLIIAVVVLLGGGGAGLGSLFGGGSDHYTDNPSGYVQQNNAPAAPQNSANSSQTPASGNAGSNPSGLGGMFGGFMPSGTSTGWTLIPNKGILNTQVAGNARDRFTQIKGNGKDTVTLMIYMCGADLESRSGMATADLMEMTKATLSDKVRIIVFTGGAKQWNNKIISNRQNQIYKVEKGGLSRLESDYGNDAMTKPSTLASFIKYCHKNYPADRNALILWDHGGGSISGYGYDENHSNAGSMTLKGINEALTQGGVTYDFIGFDACLMATVENALMLSNYADYLIGSEETEPGVGWYYTNWLTELSKNTSMLTIELGKRIADDFVSVCQQKCNGQKTTLSVIDLAELSQTVPDDFKAFAESTLDLVEGDQYKLVSDARSRAREFAVSSKCDQVDLVSLADAIGTPEAENLCQTILASVKYNQTSNNMTDAYGLSIYFPYQKVSKVQNAVSAYDAIGMDSTYAECIQKFASLETAGQAVSGGSASPLNSLTTGYISGGTPSSAIAGEDMITQILGALMGGGTGNVAGLSGGNASFFGRSLDLDRDVQYLAEHQFDPGQLVWSTDDAGNDYMHLSEDQWALVHDLELNVFVDDGEGYIDLGLDNVYNWTDEGDLSGEFGYTWLAINSQPVPYYHTDTIDDGEQYTITGYVPAYVNDVQSKLILVFDNEHPYGYIAGVETVYDEDETEVVAKQLTQLKDGDVIDLICDYYTYDGEFYDKYLYGEQIIVDGEPEISDVSINGDRVSAAYRFTDIYNQQYWTPIMK